MKRRETPLKRVNPSGEIVWVARYSDADGKRRSAGTRKLKREAQELIDAAYEAMDVSPTAGLEAMTIGEYAELWPERHPRPAQTTASHRSRLRAVLAIPVDGRLLADWPYRDLRRRHMVSAFDHMLRVEGRAQKGAIGLRNTLSAMTEDAITDDVAEVNFAKGAQVRANDPRIRKPAKRARIWTFDQLREFSAAARSEVRKVTPKPEPHRHTGETLHYSAVNYEPMVATLCLANFRIGEVFALLRAELDLQAGFFYPTGTAYEGVITRGDTREKKHEGENPIAPSLAAILRDLPPRIDTPLLFPTPKGTCWHDSDLPARCLGAGADRQRPTDPSATSADTPT